MSVRYIIIMRLNLLYCFASSSVPPTATGHQWIEIEYWIDRGAARCRPIRQLPGPPGPGTPLKQLAQGRRIQASIIARSSARQTTDTYIHIYASRAGISQADHISAVPQQLVPIYLYANCAASTHCHWPDLDRSRASNIIATVQMQ